MSYTYEATNVPFSKGRLTQVSNGSSGTNYATYDALGRITQSNQQTAGQTYNFAYAYNLSGSLTSETYPSGRTVSTCYDGANRTSSVVLDSCGSPTENYVTGVVYWPHGAPKNYTLGNNLSPFALYNSRLQTSNSWGALNNDANRFLYVTTLNWGASNNNGNLISVTEQLGNAIPQNSLTALTQIFTYDGVNRLTSVNDSGGWSRSFGYDPYGNNWVIDNSAGLGLSPATPTYNVYDGNNRNTSQQYDAAGNQTGFSGLYNFAYDAENRLTSEQNNLGGLSATYSYDGDGHRVQKTTASGTTIYVYDALGQLAAEYSSAGAGTPPCQTCYFTYDHLGSVRMITDQNGAVVARHDYLPFGEEIPGDTIGRSSQLGFGAADQVNQKFTGQERDAESGLDFFQARYYGSALGRFTSPDPENAGADPYNPQTWNGYGYVLNSPLSGIDPDGMDPTRVSCPGCTTTVYSGPLDPITLFPTYWPNWTLGGLLPSDFWKGAEQLVTQGLGAPRNPIANGNRNNCVAGFAAAGAGVGAGAGAFVGGTAGGFGGGAFGTLVEPLGGTIAGGVLGAEGGISVVAPIGGAVGGGVGFLLGNVVCSSGTGGGGGGKGGGQPASEKTAQDMAKQIERDLGKDARRAFHDAKQGGIGDRTLAELKADAKALYQEFGKTPPNWMQ